MYFFQSSVTWRYILLTQFFFSEAKLPPVIFWSTDCDKKQKYVFKQQLTNLQVFKADHSTGKWFCFCTVHYAAGHIDLVAQILLVASHVTNSMEQSSSSESTTASQEIPYLLWNLKLQYHVHKNLSPVPIPSQINPVHDLSFDVLKACFNIILPSTTRSSKCSLSLMFPTKRYMHLSSPPIRATSPAHLLLRV